MDQEESERAKGAYRVADLVRAGFAKSGEAAELEEVARGLAVAVTPEMLRLIAPGDRTGPIARQFLPDARELEVTHDELADPIGDETHSPVRGVVHRYPDRALLKPIAVCPVYCRFCFRRDALGAEGATLSAEALDRALSYIEAQPAIREVILTGGDPMILAHSKLGAIVRRLDAIEHVEVIRVHTRVPAVDPSRVTEAMVAALKTETPVFVVLHANHASELTSAAKAACARLVDAGLPMLSQTVLLRGINDDAAVLAELFRALVRMRVKPYYLHHGDLARGTSHFRTTIERGQALMRELRGRVSGLCQPTYVLDIPGGHGKVPIGPTSLSEADERGARTVIDYLGVRHRYPPLLGGDQEG